MTRRDYTSFEEFENSAFAGRDEVLTVVTERDWIKSDLTTNCKNWKTAVRRFFKALDPQNDNPAFSGWYDGIVESCENGYFEMNDFTMGDGSRNEFPSWAYGVEEIDEGCWYIFLNVFVGTYEKPVTLKAETIKAIAQRVRGEQTNLWRAAQSKDAILEDMAWNDRTWAEEVIAHCEAGTLTERDEHFAKFFGTAEELEEKTETAEVEEKEEEQNTMTNTEKLTKDNKRSLKAGDELRFSNGDHYIIDTVIDTGRSVCFTLTDKRDGKRIYSHPSSECYGAEIIRAAETEEDTDTNINEKENETMTTNNTNINTESEEVERINAVALVEEITEAVTQTPARSAWAKGVKEYALEMLEDMAFNAEHGYLDSDSFSNRKMLMNTLLNGADNWNQYSWGGSALIYDGDIAKRLCNASELKKTRNGERKPNSSEEWLDTQARALGQAAQLIINQVCFPVGA